jgi:hypothetical protein
MHVHLAADDAAGPVVLREVRDEQLARSFAHRDDPKPVTPRELVPVEELVQLLDRGAGCDDVRPFAR